MKVKVCKVDGDKSYMLIEGPVMEVCACIEILGENFSGCGDVFVFACSRKWA